MTTRIRVFDLLLFIIFGSVILGIGYDLCNKLRQRFSQANANKIDWHDWNLIEEEKSRTGLGEHGEKAYLDFYPPHTKEINATFGYNGYLSDKIALNRSLKDLRPPG